MPEFRAASFQHVTVVPARSGEHRKDPDQKPRRRCTAALALLLTATGAVAYALMPDAGPGGRRSDRTQLALADLGTITAADADTSPEHIGGPSGRGAGKGAAGQSSDRSGPQGPAGEQQPRESAGGAEPLAQVVAPPQAPPSVPAPPAAAPTPETGAPGSKPSQPLPPAPPAQSPAPPQQPEDHVSLSEGAVDPRVRDLHVNLRALDLFPGDPSDEFCSDTKEAVRTFQEREGLTADPPGVYGPQTHKALKAKVEGKPVPGVPDRPVAVPPVSVTPLPAPPPPVITPAASPSPVAAPPSAPTAAPDTALQPLPARAAG
ncbi:peptidoglycan-binding domain-containing protein [Streptomyces sp. IBSNAI002]|uniref:peptidoglycan-binding domain-containing protein n=1 Tax=Streptomyces sp. IBSNAI002 TaxID=3457500 RepID=UPI003FD3FB90